MKQRRQIPKIPSSFFKWYCKNERYEELHGDLEELFLDRLNSRGARYAKWQYALDVIRCCQSYAWKKRKGHSNSNIGMFKNYYFSSIRNLLKYKSYFLINLSGLTIGLASFTLIALYVTNELSYDRFHRNHENIYRISNRAVINGIPNSEAPTSGPMANTLLNNYPEVLKATRLFRSKPLLIGNGNKKIHEDNVLFADDSFFDVFEFQLVNGDPSTALSEPRSMILSESYAKKYFGDSDPLGQQLTVDEDSIFYTVRGIVKDIPANSHIQFDMMGSIITKPQWNSDRWIGVNQHTYAVLRGGTSVKELEEKMIPIFYNHMAPEIEYFTGWKIAEWESAGAGNSVQFKLVSLADIHLKSDYTNELQPTGNLTYIYIYSIIAFIILFIAIFNFVNLATAHSATRAKEVGIRKVIGSTRKNLVIQFMLESVLISFFATCLSVIVVIFVKPAFVDLIGKELAYGVFSNYLGVVFMFSLSILVGIIAGFYPALILSSFTPTTVLKGKVHYGMKTGWLRNVLVVIQFAASVIIIIGTVVIYQQINYMVTKHLGFDKEQIVVIKRPDSLGKNLKVFKEELSKRPDVTVVSNSETIPGKDYAIRSYRKKEDPKTYLFNNNQVTYEHQQLLGLELKSGRFFSKSYRADSSSVIINETAAQAFGFDDPIGKQLVSAFRKGENLTIIGVVKNYNIASLHEPMAPMTLELDPGMVNGYVSVKLSNGKNIRESIGGIEDAWEKHATGMPFQYFFFDQDYAKIYHSETSTGQVLLVFSILSVFIACIGLVGLVAYTASVRSKEIGIRKVLGANLPSLIRLLSNDIVKLMGMAILVSWPLAYFVTKFWLENFSDRVIVNPWIYLAATLALVIMVGFAISFQTLKTALSNPIDSLKQE